MAAGTRSRSGAATTTTKKPTTKTAAAKLPVIDVGRFEAVSRELERLVAENTRMFITKGQEYRQAHREGTSRPLTAQEASEIAAGMGADPRSHEDRSVAVQQSELAAYDEPSGQEVMLAAGVATAPAFVKAARRATALIEMPVDTFWDAVDNDELDDAIEGAAAELLRIDLVEARGRAKRALEHYAEAAGVNPGNAASLLWDGLMAAMEQAAKQLGLKSDSLSSSLIASRAPTTGVAPKS